MDQDLHFRVDGTFITDFVRQRYWFENEKEHALKMLGTIEGLTVNDAYTVINGDAKLVSEKDTLFLVKEPDPEFQEELKKHKEFLKQKEVAEKQEEIEYNNTMYEMMDACEKYNIIITKPEGHILNRTFSDREVTSRQLLQFESFADYVIKESCNKDDCKETCGLLYNCEKIKEFLSKAQIPAPEKMQWRTFRAGRSLNNKDDYQDVNEIEVIKFGPIPVRKKLLDSYVDNFVFRQRQVQREGFGNVWYKSEELEGLRRQLHREILVEAGFNEPSGLGTDMSESAQIFRAMVEVYLEKKAKLFGAI